MSKTLWLIPSLTLPALLFVSSAAAQDKKMAEQHAALLNETLKQVIDSGARIFNDNGDYAGCYRMWQGSLMSIRPFVPADMQASIDKGLASANKIDSYADKAFELRKTLDDLRAKTKFAVKDGEAKKGDGKTGEITGVVTFDGKPLGDGTITLITGEKKVATAVLADGTFQFKSVPTGDYRVAIQRDAKAKGALPNRYSSADTSGLTIQVQAGKQTTRLELVK